MATTKGKTLGPRTTVVFASTTSKKNKNPSYVFMLKSTANYFGFKETPNAVVKTKKGIERAIRGSVGAKRIKVPLAKAGTAKGGKKVIRYKSIPVPAGASIKSIKAFLQKATKNKPDTFVTPDGRTYPVGSKTSASK